MNNRVYRVKCRNPNCPNPNPDRVFEFRPKEYDWIVFRGPFKKPKEYQDEIFVVHCERCGWEKRIHIFKEDPDDKVY